MSPRLLDVIPTRLFHDGPFRWRLAVRALEAEGWLRLGDADRGEAIGEKHRILAEHRSDAVASLPGSEAASAEVLALVEAAVDRAGVGRVADSDRSGSSPWHPLEQAARLVAEDLCVMERRDDYWVLTAAVVCFPTRWSPADKIGSTLAAIHGPVPQYETIAASVDRFFDRLRPGSLVWRPNWSITTDPARRLPVDRRGEPVVVDPADPLAGVWLRVERQTLRRLDRHRDAIVFGIGIHRWPLRDVLADLDGDVAAHVEALPDDVAGYKSLRAWRSQLVDAVRRG